VASAQSSKKKKSSFRAWAGDIIADNAEPHLHACNLDIGKGRQMRVVEWLNCDVHHTRYMGAVAKHGASAFQCKVAYQ